MSEGYALPLVDVYVSDFSGVIERSCLANRLIPQAIVESRQHGKALLNVIGLEAEGFVNMMLVHDDVAEAIHDAESAAMKPCPELVSLTMRGWIGPVDIEDGENVPIPKAGGFKTESVLQQ